MTFSADIIHLGPQKTATTWIYHCFAQHPEIAAPEQDAIHYYSMLYHRGTDWYQSHFTPAGSAETTFDPTPNYFRSPLAIERIYSDNPNSLLICCLRHPIERAFSHYWHEKKKNRFNFTFEECFSNFDLFTNWIEPSLYTVHLERIRKYFPDSQLLIQIYDDLLDDPAAFAASAFRFAGVDPDFQPTILNQPLNVARPRPRNSFARRFASRLSRSTKLTRKMQKILKNSPMAYEQEWLIDIAPQTKRELTDLFSSEIDYLETLLDRDLSHWRHMPSST